MKLNVSAPIIPFREAVVPPPKVDTLNEAITNENEIKQMWERDLGAAELVNDEGTVSIVTPNQLCSLEIQASPLPEKVTQSLDENREVLRVLSLSTAAGGQGGGASELSISEGMLSQLSNSRRISPWHYTYVLYCRDSPVTTGSTSRTAYVANDIVHCICTHSLITHAGIHITCMCAYTHIHTHTSCCIQWHMCKRLCIRTYVHSIYDMYVHSMYVSLPAQCLDTMFCVFNRSTWIIIHEL